MLFLFVCLFIMKLFTQGISLVQLTALQMYSATRTANLSKPIIVQLIH